MTNEEIAKVRVLALEEFRQELKWQNWDISSLLIAERAYDKLVEKKPDRRYELQCTK